MEYANDEIGTKQKLAAQTMLSQIIEFTRSKVFKLSQSHIHQAAIFNLGKLNTKEAFEFASGEVLSQISSIPKERFQSATPQEFEAIMRRILWKKGSPGTIGKHQVNIYALVRLAQAMGNFSDPRAVSVLMFLGRWAAMNANNAVPITGLSHLEEKVALAFGQIAEHSLKDSSNAELLLLAKESSEEFELLLGRVLKEDRRCSTYVSLAYLKSLMAFYSAGFYTQDQAKSYLSKMASRMSSTEINQAVSGYLGKIDPINYLLNLRDRPIFTMPFDPSQLVTMEINGNGTARAQLLSDIAGLFTIASDILKNSNDRETRRAAIRAASQPIDMLKKMLRAKDPDVFLTAFLALANLLGKDGLSFLTQSYTLLAIKDSKITGPMADIFPSMLSAIAKLGGDEALQFLTKRIQTVHNVEEKITVARAVSLMFEAKSED
jgi:hypothetical protein